MHTCVVKFWFVQLQVHNVNDLEIVMELGSKNRSVGATLMNVDSSRSHSIFSIDIEMMEVGDDGRERLRAGRLNLVDLAGSERQSKTGSTGCLLYTSPSPRDATLSRMPSSA